jgi:hypothetical protein
MSFYDQACAAQLSGPVEDLATEIRALITKPKGESRSAEARRNLQLKALQHHLAVEFGRIHGWTPARHDFTLECLAWRGLHSGSRHWLAGNSDTLDHPFFYRLGRRAAAIAAHLYDHSTGEWRAELTAWAATHHLASSFPDFPSWWFPSWTTLVLCEPGQVAGS